MGLEHFPVERMDYGAGKPALLIGDDPAQLEDVAGLLRASGIRVGGICVLAGGAQRLDQQASASLLWLECGPAWPGDALIERIATFAARGTPAVVVLATDQIDAAMAALPHENVQLLVGPTMLDRAAAIAVALASESQPARVSDVGRDNGVRLRQLSDEMARIAASMARLSTVPGAESRPSTLQQDFGKVPEVDAEKVRAVIRARRLRSRFFDEGLFADPAWDMLLDLFAAEIAQHRVPVSSLCIAAAVPATTALRWIKTMSDNGLFVRRADPHDRRRVFIELAPRASLAMRQYFAEAGDVAGL